MRKKQKKQNKTEKKASYRSGQLQKTQTLHWTSKDLKATDISPAANAKRGKTCASDSPLLLIGLQGGASVFFWANLQGHYLMQH